MNARVAIVCDRQPPRVMLVETYLQTHGVTEPTWYPPGDVDDLEQAIRADGVQRVVFPQTADFLRLLLDEGLDPDAWQAPGLRIEFAGSDAALDPAQIASILAEWKASRHRRRRQRALAGLILSVLAIAAAWIVLALAH